MQPGKYVLVSMGGLPDRLRTAWMDAGVTEFCSLSNPATTGRRFGLLALGLGVDSLRVAIRARVSFRHSEFICLSPWIAVALKLLGVRRFCVVGVYSVPGSRSWKVLRWAIGKNPTICMVQAEAELWNDSGGNASHVLYGNTFGYPAKLGARSGELRPKAPVIFSGGLSDRSETILDRLIGDVLASGLDLQLVIADGSGPRLTSLGESTVRWLPYVSQGEFGRWISESDIVLLPLSQGVRSAGHMVAVGALECGVPVVTTKVGGMAGYIDGSYISSVEVDENGSPASPLLPILLAKLQDGTRPGPDAIREYWTETFRCEVFARRIVDGLRNLSADTGANRR